MTEPLTQRVLEKAYAHGAKRAQNEIDEGIEHVDDVVPVDFYERQDLIAEITPEKYQPDSFEGYEILDQYELGYFDVLEL